MINAEFFYGISLMIIGFGIEALGWKIHQQIVGISGLVFGLVVGDFIGSQLLRLDFLFRVVILLMTGLGFFLLFFIYMRASIAFTSGVIGALIVSGFTSYQILTEWRLTYAVFQTVYNYPALLISFLLSFLAGYRYYKLGYIVLSTGIGSIFIAYGGIFIGIWSYNGLGLFVLLSLMLGAIIQLSQEGAIRERKLQFKEFKYCPSCGKLLDLGSTACSKCGNIVIREEK